MQLSIPTFDWCFFLSLLTEFCMLASVPCKTIYMILEWTIYMIWTLKILHVCLGDICFFKKKKKGFWYYFYIWCDKKLWSMDNSFEVHKIILKRSSKCFLLLKSKNTLSVIYFLTLLNLFALLESAQLLHPPITIVHHLWHHHHYRLCCYQYHQHCLYCHHHHFHQYYQCYCTTSIVDKYYRIIVVITIPHQHILFFVLVKLQKLLFG